MLQTLMSTSTHIWPGVLASKARDGVMAALCRARGAEAAVRVAGRVQSRLAFQVLSRDTYEVLIESSDVCEIAGLVETGPALQTWDSFQQVGPWGDTGRLLPVAGGCPASSAP